MDVIIDKKIVGKLVKIGDSFYFNIPRAQVNEFNLTSDSYIEIKLERVIK
jgi:hypothetical protein